ncbi:MAG TPA: AAA family ATPase, partial [Gemmata sp.]|nr:AAA family ATPase [Gemmata sp.]
MGCDIVFPVGLIYRKVGPGAVLAEALFYPEFSRLGASRSAAGQIASQALSELIPLLSPGELIRRRRSTTAREFPFTLILEPPRGNEAWREPIALKFHAVVWDHERPNVEPIPSGTRMHKRLEFILARVVEFGIDVIAGVADNLTKVLQNETLSALRRMNLSVGLKKLASIQTSQAFEVEWTEVTVKVPSLKDRAIREANVYEEKKTLLQKIATQLRINHEPAYEIEETVDETEKALTANPAQSVLLIGPSGVGKTASVRQLAERWAMQGGRLPIFQTSGARIVAGQSGFGMWEQRCQDLIKEVAKKRAVLHVGALVELMEVGKSEYNHTGIATFLRPAISRGDILCVAEATPEQLPLIEKQDPQLLDAFRHITLDEPNDAKGRAIFAAFAREYPNRRVHQLIAKREAKEMRKRKQKKRRDSRKGDNRGIVSALLQDRSLDDSAIAAIDRLHRRYATYSAYPGRPLRFLENLLRDPPISPPSITTGERQKPKPIDEEDVYLAFTRETGLPRSIIDPAVPLDVEKTHRWFSSRVVGQTDAVNLVVDLLATVKAGLTRPNRPIASLLFIGPTGVGKTEMAKALAEFLFGSKDRLTRFDMSEFADPVSVRRLVGGAFGTEGLLTVKVREQPFSVLLLDEVEKADGSFFDLLLQALGEARLTDAGGRLADFRNTVVILTSNLGAESYRQGMTGFTAGVSTPTKSQASEHFARAVEQFLRPEMFNRLDRVVPFAPLEAGTIRCIADREWQKILNRDGVRFREVALTSSDDLLDTLAAIGFDARYGARPLKRAMERELLSPLARQMNRHPGETPLTVNVEIANGKPDVAARPVQGPRGRSNREPTSPAGKHASTVQVMRRWHQLVASSSTVRELDNEVYQLALAEQRIYRKQKVNKKLTQYDAELLARLGRLRELADEVKRQRSVAFDLENDSVVAFHDGLEPDDELFQRLAEAHRDWDRLLLRLYALNSTSSDTVTLALFAEHRGHLAELAAAYRAVAHSHGLTVQMMRYDLPSEGVDTTPPPTVKPPVAKKPRPPQDAPTTETRLPPTVWDNDRLFATNPAKLLLVRKALDPLRTEEYAVETTLGLALTIVGTGAHVRFWHESGLHEIRKPDDR